jgi:GT2 family glycosyltransferase
MPSVAVVIVSYNGDRFLPAALGSLVASAVRPDSVLLVDNRSTDQSVAVAKETAGDLPLEVIDAGGNLGFGRANNLGIARALDAGADFVFLMNQDLKVHPDALTHLLRAADDHPAAGVLSPLQLNYDGSAVDPGLGGSVPPAMVVDGLAGRLADYYPAVFAPASALLVRAEVFRRVGGFDPLFFMYGEDEDLCRRVLKAGFEIGLVPAAHAFHWNGLTKRRSWRWQRNWEYTRGLLHVLHSDWPSPANLLTLAVRWAKEMKLSPRVAVARLWALQKLATVTPTVRRHRAGNPAPFPAPAPEAVPA